MLLAQRLVDFLESGNRRKLRKKGYAYVALQQRQEHADPRPSPLGRIGRRSRRLCARGDPRRGRLPRHRDDPRPQPPERRPAAEPPGHPAHPRDHRCGAAAANPGPRPCHRGGGQALQHAREGADLRRQAKRGRVARLAFWTITMLWAGWFLLSEWAFYSESGSILSPRPIEAHDEYDLLFWTVLLAWT